jgi:hypothetical protein
MSDNISIRGPGPTYLGGISTGERTPQKTRPTPEGTPPPKINLDTGPDSIPKLDLPTMQIDALGDVADKFLALKLKTSDQQLAGSMKDVQDRGAVMKSKNADISNKLNEAAQKIAEAEKAQAAMKALSWIAVALSILFAIFTGGVGAIVGAAVATTMAVLNETGVMTKLTDAIAKGLEGTGDPPMSSELAKKWAQGIMMGITLAVSVATVATSLATSATQFAGLASKLPQIAATIAEKTGTAVTEATARIMVEVAQKVITGTKVVQSLMAIGQGAAGISGGVNRFQAADIQASMLEDKAFLRRLQQKNEEEQELIESIMSMMSDMTSRVVEAMNSQSDTMSDVLKQMRPQTG